MHRVAWQWFGRFLQILSIFQTFLLAIPLHSGWYVIFFSCVFPIPAWVCLYRWTGLRGVFCRNTRNASDTSLWRYGSYVPWCDESHFPMCKALQWLKVWYILCLFVHISSVKGMACLLLCLLLHQVSAQNQGREHWCWFLFFVFQGNTNVHILPIKNT